MTRRLPIDPALIGEPMPPYGNEAAPTGSLPFLVYCRDEVLSLLSAKETASRYSLEAYRYLSKGGYRQLCYPLRPSKKRLVWLHYTSWRQFCETEQPYGLGHSPVAIDALITEQLSIRAIVEKDTQEQRPDGGNNNPHGLGGKSGKQQDEIVTLYNVQGDNAAPKAPTGNSKQAALRRLRKAAEADPAKYQETYEQVLAEKVTPHRALILVGLKQEPTRLEQAQKLIQRMSPAEREQLFAWVRQSFKEEP